MIRKLFAAVAMTALMAGASLAADVKPAVVYDTGGRNDKSFNESAFTGAEKFKADTGIAYQDFEIQNDSQREQALRHTARHRKGHCLRERHWRRAVRTCG